ASVTRSARTTGAERRTGTPYDRCSSAHFNNSPSLAGVIVIVRPAAKMARLPPHRTWTSTRSRYRCHRQQRSTQLCDSHARASGNRSQRKLARSSPNWAKSAYSPRPRNTATASTAVRTTVLTALVVNTGRLVRSFQTDAPAKHTRPESGIASYASGESEDCRGGHDPTGDGEQDRHVGQQHLLGLLADVVAVHEQQVAEDAEDDERDR